MLFLLLILLLPIPLPSLTSSIRMFLLFPFPLPPNLDNPEHGHTTSTLSCSSFSRRIITLLTLFGGTVYLTVLPTWLW